MLRINQVKLALDEPRATLRNRVATLLHIKNTDIKTLRVYKESIDARRNEIHKIYTVDIEVNEELEKKLISQKIKDVSAIEEYQYVAPNHGTKPSHGKVIVVGFGPAGMMASLLLAEEGYSFVQ